MGSRNCSMPPKKPSRPIIFPSPSRTIIDPGGSYGGMLVVSPLIQSSARCSHAVLRMPGSKYRVSQLFATIDLIYLGDYLTRLVSVALGHHERTVERHINLHEEIVYRCFVSEENQPSRI